MLPGNRFIPMPKYARCFYSRAGAAGKIVNLSLAAAAILLTPGLRAAATRAGARLTPAPAPYSAPASPQARFQAQLRNFQARHNPLAQLVALYRMARLQPWLRSPQSLVASWTRLAHERRLTPLLRAEIEAELGREQLRLGQARAAAAIWHSLGILQHWRAVGPFDNSSPGAIRTPQGPERAFFSPAAKPASYAGKTGPVRWRILPWASALEQVNLANHFTPTQSVSAYLATWVDSPRAQTIALRFSDSGAIRIWVNGGLLYTETASHPRIGFDQYAVAARLAAGWNLILVKAGDLEGGPWKFALRLTTPQGRPILLASSNQPHAFPDWRNAAPAIQAKITDLTTQAKAAALAAKAGADDWLRYAWILEEKGNYNAGNHSAANAFEQAELLAPELPVSSETGSQGAAPDSFATPAQQALATRIRLDFAHFDKDQSRAYRTLQQILAVFPNNPEALADRGWIELQRFETWPARRDFIRALRAASPAVSPAASKPASSPATPAISSQAIARYPRAYIGLLETYASFGMQTHVLRAAGRLQAAGWSHAQEAAISMAEMLERLGLTQATLRWGRAAWQTDQNNPGVLLHTIMLANSASNFTQARQMLAAGLRVSPDKPLLWRMQAQMLAGAGDKPQALAAARRAIALNPQAAKNQIALGEIEAQTGHPQATAQAWEAALRLDPQNASLQRRLQLLAGHTRQTSFYQAYRLNPRAVIAAWNHAPQPQLESGPLLALAETTVVRIFPSGNTGRYVQMIFRVNNRVGAQALAEFPVTYDPRRQVVNFLAARVYHPDGSVADAAAPGDALVNQSVGYETYYDVRNKYVILPALRPGDCVEIAYRILPSVQESLYGNYFGDIVPFQSGAPELYQQFVVETPRNLPLYSHAVRFTGHATQKLQNGLRIERWTLRNQSAYIGEPESPPAIEQEPYIEVSAFDQWPQFAHWYQGLIRETFVMDRSLRQTTARLVRGLKTEKQKVEAIYSYVIRNTHYVALEFGIHGYRPYPVSEVFRRRFGDCKDKASLLVAMLAQVGIPADIVLVRTRELGLVSTRLPVVGDFDHAIAYVPSLGWYLDGTAEYNGAQELPGSDQHALVFRIPLGRDLRADGLDPKPEPKQMAQHLIAAPVVTPFAPPARNLVDKVLTGNLRRNGTLKFEQQWSLLGQDAPYFRHAMQLAGRRAGVLQAMLRGSSPGLVVHHASANNANHYDRPLEITFSGKIPNFARPAPEGLRLPRQITPVSWLPRMAPLETRTMPVSIGSPQDLRETMVLQLPQGDIPTLPSPLHLQTPFGDFSFLATWTNGNLMVKSDLKTLRAIIPVAEYPEFRRFWMAVDQKLSAGIRVQQP